MSAAPRLNQGDDARQLTPPRRSPTPGDAAANEAGPIEAGGRAGRVHGREILERIERCVSVMVYYHADGYSWSGANLLHEEAPALSRWLSAPGLGEDFRGRVLGLVERDLCRRYGREIGGRLNRALLRALEDAAEAAREAETPYLHRKGAG